jgi:hypothetical protein
MPALCCGRDLFAGAESPVLVLEFHPSTLAFSGHSPDDLIGLLASSGYAFYPIAAYSLHTHDPYMNGIAAKPEHIARFPALRRWQQQPLSGREPTFPKTFTYIPLQ